MRSVELVNRSPTGEVGGQRLAASEGAMKHLGQHFLSYGNDQTSPDSGTIRYFLCEGLADLIF